ncbi:MAG TPA: RAD55 family ATPase [Nitrospinota bacterium]|nr:RAD55 family ATPase [Nitrospinota bacterium]
MDMLLTDIKGFDELTGGIPKGTRTIIIGPSGSGKTVFSMQFLWTGLKNSERVSYNIFDRPFPSLMEYFKSFNWKIEEYIEKGFFIPIQSFTHHEEYKRDPRIKYFELTNLEEMKRIDLELSEKKVTRLICGDISQVIFSLIPIEQMNQIESWTSNWIWFEKVTVMDVILSGFLDEIGKKNFDLNKKGAQNIIHLRVAGRKREMKIEKMEGVQHPLDWIPFVINEGGIEIHL